MFDCEGVGGAFRGCGGVGLGLCDKGIRVQGGAEEVGVAACIGQAKGGGGGWGGS